MRTANPLIRTKLHLPITRTGLVSRPRLQEQVAQGLHGPLTLVTAPAGFGKTTLAASCVACSGMPVAWLSLDKNDNQAGRFLTYLVAGLQEADPTIGSEAAQLVSAQDQQAPPEAILTSLINDLDSTGREIALVLDDYQFIHNQAVHEQVAFLLEHSPATLHVLIATRSDPPLPLARLRVSGTTVELRAADLSFTEPEAAQFLNDVMGLHLDARSVAALEERTEGWIAGLQMAALSMRDRKDVLGFIEGFSGTNRYILDYLLEEVLAGQSPEIQRFLLCTSILDRLTAPLCDAVLATVMANDEASKREGDGSSTRPESPFPRRSAATLDYLERANLFLVPLDDERTWYRYHHLFADLLRARLGQVYPGLSPQLHSCAAAWLECEGMTVEAVNHTLAAGEYDRAARMVEENTTRLLAQGELNALMGWIEVLPAEVRLARPWLCLHQAYTLAFAGRLAEAAPLVTQVEAMLETASSPAARSPNGQADKPDALSIGTAEARALRGAVAAIRAFTSVMTGQEAEAISYARQASELLPAENLWDRASAEWALGYALRSRGLLAEARSAFEEQVRLARAMGNIWTLVSGLTDLAWVLRAQGMIHQARAVLEEALAEAGRQGARTLGFIARTEAHLAIMLYEQNEVEAAHRLLSDAVSHARFWPNPNHLALTHLLMARVLLVEGDLHGARTFIREAERIRKSATLTRPIRRMVEAELVRVWLAFQRSDTRLAAGDPLADQVGALATAWRSELSSSTELMDETDDVAAAALARVSLAAGRAEEAITLLEPLTRNARAAGHTNAAIGFLVLTAIARQTRGDGRAISAPGDLKEALGLAEAGGYVRVFLDEGRPMQMLLVQWVAHAAAGPLRDYALHLLNRFEAEPHPVTVAHEKAPPAGGLLEPLSQREMEVLDLVSTGRTNQEIAERLIVSPGTVKAHTASIYRKLDVANRTEAVARARQLGILP